MRKLVINDDLGFGLKPEESIDIIAKAGWDGIFTGWDEQNGNKKLAGKIADAGLYYQSVHAPFTHCDKLWEIGEEGDSEQRMLEKCLEDCADAGVKTVVMHAIIGMEKNSPCDAGIERFARLADKAQTLGISLAVENTEGECYLDMIIEKLGKHPALGFCIDTGHEMCYNYRHDIIGKFGTKLIATHLNDNLGMTGEKLTWLDDSHLMPFDGAGDWENIAARLNKAGYGGALTFELTAKNRPGRHTHDRYAELSLLQFYELALAKAKRFRDILENRRYS